MIFPVIFAALYVTHLSVLRLPYYWDEAGYYIPAAWDFFRTGSLIPLTTVSNAHPPLPSVYLALWWKASGFYPEVTREAVLMAAAVGLLGVWRLAQRVSGVGAVAFWTTLLTGLYPIWFAQSTLAHADIFAAACTLWGMVYALPARDRRPVVAAVWFWLAVLSKETAIVVPAALACCALIGAMRAEKAERRRLLVEAAWLASCVAPLVAWYAWHDAKTGFLFGNPDFLRYNAQETLTPLRFVAAFGHRLLHLFAHMNMFVPVLLTLAAMMLAARRGRGGEAREGLEASVRRRMLILLAANAVLFSVLGGALLCRYLLPMYPLVILLAVSTFHRRVPYWQGLAVLSGAAFVAGLFVNPPYGFAPEDNLEYARVIRLHQAAIARLTRLYPGATVLTAWPVSDYLRRPELGYVKEPWDVWAIDDFSEPQIERAEGEPGRYSAGLVFSTKFDPPPLVVFGTRSQALDERYFGLHHDLTPEVIARRLNGTVAWRAQDHGMWAGVLRFNRQFEASAGEGDGRLPAGQ
ncbi:glycosyltransferase family 39 protein [Acidobacteria bacterium AB60]|nr:glycosyltransferase family 39 protein [Acidobacteria bacterium AB60]